jgi:hypothetical protein
VCSNGEDRGVAASDEHVDANVVQDLEDALRDIKQEERMVQGRAQVEQTE